MVVGEKQSEAKVKRYVQFSITPEEAEELGRYAAIAKVPIATMAKSGCFMRARALAKEASEQ